MKRLHPRTVPVRPSRHRTLRSSRYLTVRTRATSRRLCAALLVGVVAVASLLPAVSAGATPKVPTPDEPVPGPLAELLENDSPAMATTGRYMNPTLPAAEELANINQRCELVNCYILAVQDGESVLDALVRLAAEDRVALSGVEELFRDLIAEPDQFLESTTGESRSVLVSDAEDALQAVEAESLIPGSGLSRRGLDPDQQSDPLSGFVGSTGQMPGPALPWTTIVDEPYRWHARTEMTIGFVSYFGSYVIGTINATYKMDLNGRETRFRQQFSTASNVGRFKISQNHSRCRIDRTWDFDYNCQNHPRPTQYLGQWRQSLRQPSAGFLPVYDGSYRRKFFEFEHSVAYRWINLNNATSPTMRINTGQSPRFNCDTDTTQVCVFE